MPEAKHQFCLTIDPAYSRPGWIVQRHGQWYLWCDPQLPVAELLCHDGSQVGCVLGFPVDLTYGMLCPAEIMLDCESPQDCTPHLVELLANSLGGRFAIFIHTQACQRFYPDASGSLAALYCLTSRQIASTPELFENLAPMANPLYETLEQLRTLSGTWYPLGLTPLAAVRVVLPNHGLDLKSWELRRYWTGESVERLPSEESALPVIRQIAQQVQRVIAAVDHKHPITMNLTSGRDSRMLLSCVKERAKAYEFHTLPQHLEADVEVAQLLAEALDLKLVIADSPAADRVVLQGLAGEVGRAFYWREGDTEETELTGQDLLSRMKLASGAPELLALAEAWLQPLQGLSPFLILDLLYIEFRLGCAMGPAMYGADRTTRFQMYPLNQRHIFELMLKLPADYRASQFLFRDLCALHWPSLLLFPLYKAFFTGGEKYQKLLHYLRIRGKLTPRERKTIWPLITRGRSLPGMIWGDLCSLARRLTRRGG